MKLVVLALAALVGLTHIALAQPVVSADGAVMRGLDKISGNVGDINVQAGTAAQYGRLQVQVTECRYPEENPSGNAYAYVIIQESEDRAPVFEGWMIASSPALNALDHPRYDIWLLRCKTA